MAAITGNIAPMVLVEHLAILKVDPYLLRQLDDGSVQIITTHDERLTRSLVYGFDDILAVRHVSEPSHGNGTPRLGRKGRCLRARGLF